MRVQAALHSTRTRPNHGVQQGRVGDSTLSKLGRGKWQHPFFASRGVPPAHQESSGSRLCVFSVPTAVVPSGPWAAAAGESVKNSRGPKGPAWKWESQAAQCSTKGRILSLGTWSLHAFPSRVENVSGLPTMSRSFKQSMRRKEELGFLIPLVGVGGSCVYWRRRNCDAVLLHCRQQNWKAHLSGSAAFCRRSAPLEASNGRKVSRSSMACALPATPNKELVWKH